MAASCEEINDDGGIMEVKASSIVSSSREATGVERNHLNIALASHLNTNGTAIRMTDTRRSVAGNYVLTIVLCLLSWLKWTAESATCLFYQAWLRICTCTCIAHVAP